MAEKQTPAPKQLKEYFTHGTYGTHISIHMPTIMGPFEIKHFLIQMLPPFYGLVYENPPY